MCFKHHHLRYPKPSSLAQRVQRYACLERHPRTHGIFLGIVRFKHHRFRYPKKPFLAQGLQRYACLERHPRAQRIFFGMIWLKHHHFRYPKNLSWPRVCRGMLVWSPTPEPTAYFFAWCVSNTTNSGFKKTPFLAQGVQRSACLERHPRTGSIFVGMVCFKHHHFRYPTTLLLTQDVQRYACLERHPRTHGIFFGMV